VDAQLEKYWVMAASTKMAERTPLVRRAQLLKKVEIAFLFLLASAAGSGAQQSGAAASNLQTTIAAACNGSEPGSVVLPVGTLVVSSVSIPSHCALYGQGLGKTVLQAAGSSSSALLLLSSESNIQLRGFTVDGACDRSELLCTRNRNAFDLIRLVSSANVIIDEVEVRNASGNGIDIVSGNRQLTIQNSEADDIGSALPAVGGAGFNIDPGGGAGNSHIRFINDSAHDNNLGFYVQSSTDTSNFSEDIVFDDVRSYANANDGWAVYTPNASYAEVRGVRLENSEAYCNGWPADGAGFSTDCTLGIFQKGPAPSSSGVGFDFNSPVLSHPIVIGNRSHDNLVDGFAFSGYTVTQVGCTGAAKSICTRMKGDAFNTNWRMGESVRIGSKEYQIFSVSSATSLTLQQGVGFLGGVYLNGPTHMFATIVGNQAYANGTTSEGAGFWNNGADSNTYSANISRLNFQDGFGCDGSAFLTYSGDQAYSNGRSPSSRHVGFLLQGCINNTYVGIRADDPVTPPTQQFGVYLDTATQNTIIQTSSVFAKSVKDFGRNNFNENGQIRSDTRHTATDLSLSCTSSSSPSVCGSALSGAVVMAPGTRSLVVRTTAVTANSEIVLTFDSSLGSRLGVVCNTTYNAPWVSNRTASTDFRISVLSAPGTNPACYTYLILN
jgi:hypothetical protein